MEKLDRKEFLYIGNNEIIVACQVHSPKGKVDGDGDYIIADPFCSLKWKTKTDFELSYRKLIEPEEEMLLNFLTKQKNMRIANGKN